MTLIEDDARSVFLAALEHAAGQWPAFLDQACGGSPELRSRVEQLLHAHQALGSIHGGNPGVTPPADGLVATVDDPSATAAEGPGTMIGPYKLLEQIGEGGFGVVFMAEQTEPVRRKVALKILKPGMDTRQVVARFEAERQALAIMDHPNIARVFDGGMTEPDAQARAGAGPLARASGSGRPYFVMELVRGVPITEFCDQHHLTPRQRLELFIPVCQAVQHAHQKGIIHRDLKPSNVLVAVHDTTPVPKVIDFGVAKALGQELTDKTLFTGFAQMIGTPLYMSPEQAGQSGLDVDTRSDVYALGVLLYELLTGTTPFAKERFRKAAYDEICRIIREEEPPKPSTRLSELGQVGRPSRSSEAPGRPGRSSHDTGRPGRSSAAPVSSLASISALRQTEPAKLTRLVRGELDWIVMKALEKDRNRRYETANGFAMDVQRYLADEPVLACPPSVAYRLRKLARRNKRALAMSAILAMALVGSVVVLAVSNVRVARERDEKARALEEAERSAAEAQIALDYVNKLLSAAGPERSRGRDVTVREVLADSEEALKTAFPDKPLIKAYVRHVIGTTYKNLGRYKEAVWQLEQASNVRASLLGRDHPNTLVTMMNWASALQHLGRLEEARVLGEEVLQRQRTCLGSEHGGTLDTMNNLANVYHRQGRYQDARAMHEKVLEVRVRVLGREHPNTLMTIANLGNALFGQGLGGEAMRHYEEALTLRKKVLGPDHPDTLIAMMNVANTLRFFERDAEARKLYEETLILQKRVLGVDHPNTVQTIANLSGVLDDQQALEDGRLMLELALASCRRVVGEEHPDTILVMHNLGRLLAKLGRRPEAQKMFEESIVIQRRVLGDDHPDTLTMEGGLDDMLMEQGQYEEARKLRAQLLERKQRLWGSEHPNVLAAVHHLAAATFRSGKWPEAYQLFENVVRSRRAALGSEHVHTLESVSSLASVCLALDKIGEAQALIDEAMPVMRRILGDHHQSTITATNSLVIIHQRHGRLDEARKLCEEQLELRRRLFGPEHRETLDAMENLANVMGEQKLLPESRKIKEEVLVLRTRILGREHPDTLRTMHNLMIGLWRERELAEARKIGEEAVALRTRVLGPDHPRTLDTMHDLACLMTDQKDWEAALPLFEHVLPREMRNRGPQHKDTLLAIYNLANTLHHLAAQVRAEKGSFEERDGLFRQALGYLEHLVKSQPDNRRNQTKLGHVSSDMARFLASWPDPALRRPKEAVERANRAVEIVGEQWLCLNTLALAQYRAESWNAALAALERSTKTRKTLVAQDAFLLAMTHWQLGHKEQANQSYDEAIAWMTKHQEELQKDKHSLSFLENLREEAKRLLQESAK